MRNALNTLVKRKRNITMEKERCNGWTNYATWRITLEWFDYDHYEEVTPEGLQELVEEGLYEQAQDNSLVYGYALAFINDVNWHEIAQHINNNLITED